MGKISVVIPTYKRPDKLENALKSVISQSYKDIEVIIIDDNGENCDLSKETKKKVDNYHDKINIKYICHEKNMGGCAARNTGINNASGDYIAFLDDDDEWLPQKLTTMMMKFNCDNNLGMVYSARIEDLGNHFFHVGNEVPKNYIEELRKGNNFIGSTSFAIVRKECFFNVGLFDVNLPAWQDIDMWVRVAEQYNLCFVPDALVIYNLHEGERISRQLNKIINAIDIYYEKHVSSQTNKLHLTSALNFRKSVIYHKFNEIKQVKKHLRIAYRQNPTDFRILIYHILLYLPFNDFIFRRLRDSRINNRKKITI